MCDCSNFQHAKSNQPLLTGSSKIHLKCWWWTGRILPDTI